MNDTALFFERFGSGLPLLVMHGGPGLDHSYFRPWLDPLGAFAELIYDDHRGNGRSSSTASLAGLILCWTAPARGEVFGRPMERDDDLRAI